MAERIKQKAHRNDGLFVFYDGGATRDRTADLLHAMQELYQLSYNPTKGFFIEWQAILLEYMVELRGIEPRTSCMPCKRSPS